MVVLVVIDDLHARVMDVGRARAGEGHREQNGKWNPVRGASRRSESGMTLSFYVAPRRPPACAPQQSRQLSQP